MNITRALVLVAGIFAVMLGSVLIMGAVIPESLLTLEQRMLYSIGGTILCFVGGIVVGVNSALQIASSTRQ